MIYYVTFKTHICKQAVKNANKCHIKFLDACRLGRFHFRFAMYIFVRLYSSNEIRNIQNNLSKFDMSVVSIVLLIDHKTEKKATYWRILAEG